MQFIICIFKRRQFSQSRNCMCMQCRKNVSSDASRAFCVFRQNVEAIVWVRLGHSSLDSTGDHGRPESSRTSVLLFRTRLYCFGCTIRAFPLSCPLGSLHPSGTDRTNRWIRVERSKTISILMLECAEIDVSTA